MPKSPRYPTKTLAGTTVESLLQLTPDAMALLSVKRGHSVAFDVQTPLGIIDVRWMAHQIRLYLKSPSTHVKPLFLGTIRSPVQAARKIADGDLIENFQQCLDWVRAEHHRENTSQPFLRQFLGAIAAAFGESGPYHPHGFGFVWSRMRSSQGAAHAWRRSARGCLCVYGFTGLWTPPGSMLSRSGTLMIPTNNIEPVPWPTSAHARLKRTRALAQQAQTLGLDWTTLLVENGLDGGLQPNPTQGMDWNRPGYL